MRQPACCNPEPTHDAAMGATQNPEGLSCDVRGIRGTADSREVQCPERCPKLALKQVLEATLGEVCENPKLLRVCPEVAPMLP